MTESAPKPSPGPGPAPNTARGTGPTAPPPLSAAGIVTRLGRRSKLVTWMVRLFLVFQGLAIVQALFDFFWPTNFVDFPGLILGFTCLQNLAVVPLVLAIGVWVLGRSYRYNRTATRLAKLIVARFVLRLIGSLLAAMTLILLVMATVPHLLKSSNVVATIETELSRMVNAHSGAYRLGMLGVLGFEGLFVLLAMLARRRLRDGHFDPAPAPHAPTAAAAAPQPLAPPPAPTPPPTAAAAAPPAPATDGSAASPAAAQPPPAASGPPRTSPSGE